MKSSPGPYIRRIEIAQFGPIAKLVWELDEDAAAPGWHVVIGDNGAGKTSFLKAVSLALLGFDGPRSLHVAASSFLREPATAPCFAEVEHGGSKRRWDAKRRPSKIGRPAARGFHAAFGADRRFIGGRANTRLESSDPVAARHASLFDPAWALRDLVQWLKDLRLDELPGVSGTTTLSWIKTFVNQPGLLPDVELVDVTSAGPVFRDANGFEHGIEALSDGYQSAVGLTLELLRQLFASEPRDQVLEPDGDQIVVGVQGIVLIDEVDAHLHPSWQQRIGVFFRRHFPHIQFIVTTHSPLVCRASEQGTIFRLPRPGTDEQGAMVAGQDRERLIYGDVLDAFGTEVFGAGVTRSEAGLKKLDRLAELNVQAKFGGSLSEDEDQERRSLQRLMVQEKQ